MSLRTGPIERELSLPDGRAAIVRVGLFDSYVPPRQQTTVALELWADGEVVAALDTLLDPGNERGARRSQTRPSAGWQPGSSSRLPRRSSRWRTRRTDRAT